MLSVRQATRYVLPLREGGSLPAVVETDDADLFVVKFRGAGQGARALVAEIIAGELARAIGLAVPEIALVAVDPAFGRGERDPEIQDVLRGSVGLNVGLAYLDGAFTFDPLADPIDPALAARIVWLDALITNVDRTARNSNLMTWNDGIWLIDHGAALYFHHQWPAVDAARARDPFAAIADHVLLARAGDPPELDDELARVAGAAIGDVVAAVPDPLLMDAPAGITPPFATAEANRAAYLAYFAERLAAPRAFAATIADARARASGARAIRREYRR